MQAFQVYIIILGGALLPVLGYRIIGEITNDDDENIPEIYPQLMEIDCKFVCFPITEPTKIKYMLFTRSNPLNGEQIEAFNSDSILASNYNPKHPTRLITHGWYGDTTAKANVLIKEAFLTKGDFNVVVIDWKACAKTINYFQARCCVEDVGKQIAEFIDFLNIKHSLEFQKLTLIGHSLGAHCMGHAGKNVKNGQINTIVGLDPAKPCFIHDNTHDRLTTTDAEYVETIHTNGGLLGFFDPVGRAAFYPNGGEMQIGCDILKPNICSHGRSYKYYAESIIENNFVPVKCKNFLEFLNKNCNIPVDDDIKMGGDPSNHGKANGIYYLKTNKQAPFGIGKS